MTRKSPLGKAADYPQRYSPEQLFPIARADNRAALGLGSSLPFHGADIWNAWELTWLNAQGTPQVACAEVRIPAKSPNIIESKSLKLYLSSFAMTSLESDEAVTETLRDDIAACAGTAVEVQLLRPDNMTGAATGQLAGDCLDGRPVSCKTWQVDSDLLQSNSNTIVRESLHSHLLRSLCPVTDQPDSGSVQINYRGPKIDRNGLLRYIVSYRQHNDFHENCVERMFVDILACCQPTELTVYARYQRRGGIDINPFRSNFETTAPNTRLWQQ
jgi:7-cyano-7-deazaguanine reductase